MAKITSLAAGTKSNVASRPAEVDLSRPVGGSLKRAVDVTLTLGALLVLSPLMLLIIAAMKISDPGPVFFGHKRVGFDGRHFRCYKFRSMATNSAELLQRLLQSDPAASAEWEATQKLRNDPRVTRLGRFLRETSLDELPQLFNVLRGEMSLIGPRPIVDEEVHRYTHRFEAYKRTRPGVTGMWQVNGRSNTSYASRVKFDTYYVRHWSLWLDVQILFKTIKVVMNREGSC
ncbi:exopolysaccharide biosynthesis polyprenyl glycosylphosphotransferase [Aureimonas flava]|uniref:Exopolysaccharide biosynthesis polyprenyl glycosylphosphotransferase n=1 Tax=Aureimonas flava TaxID=2320271 RepID=A0A3A1WIE3_9HYPH|nr:exopolysaccharide biosynthesis polyprenyl glycosylphosphotransferase [Aureimonas flava]RIY00026.1 exopolysaccharide biosynthesis polyprenyl glycosylphosphotransferase [Aureimonas flava]